MVGFRFILMCIWMVLIPLTPIMIVKLPAYFSKPFAQNVFKVVIWLIRSDLIYY